LVDIMPTNPPDDREALEQIRGLARANRFEYSRHARQRMRERNVRDRDVRAALCDAVSCSQETEIKWRVCGPDFEGDDLTMIVLIEEGLLVVTLGLD
jgi:hypothetical protein